MAPRGRFITFEGIDGSGKSSALRQVAEALRKDGLDPLVTREETEGPAGEWVRHSIREGWPARATLHLFLADRAQHVATQVAPALAAGRVVLCDRFLHSTLAYQSVTMAGEATVAQLRALHDGWCPEPDRVLLFDSDPRLAVERASRRSARAPYEKVALLEKVRAAYLGLAAEEPERFTVLRADQAMDGLVRDALAAVKGALR
jgi:dTMP kinase